MERSRLRAPRLGSRPEIAPDPRQITPYGWCRARGGSRLLLCRAIMIRIPRVRPPHGFIVGPGVGIGLGPGEDLTNHPPGVMRRARDLADGHAIASGAANRSAIVHREHILASVRDRVSRKTSRLNGDGYGGSLLRAQ